MEDKNQIIENPPLPANVLANKACRFCYQLFYDKRNNPVTYTRMTICRHCRNLMHYNDNFYNVHESKTILVAGAQPRKLSDILKEVASETENDNHSWDLLGKVKRQEKVDKFQEHFLPFIQEKIGKENIFWEEKKQSFQIRLPQDDQPLIVDFFPKANRLLIRKENRWINNGRLWLEDFLFPESAEQA